MHPPPRTRFRAVLATTGALVLTALLSVPAVAAPPTLDDIVDPVDPQDWENPDDMTWDDYTAVPGIDWADPSRRGSERDFNIALVMGDFSDQPFLITQAAGTHPFGNPQPVAENVAPEDVAQFYEDLLNTPNDLNNGHTLHEYWMEDSAGRYGVELTAFGGYRLPGKLHEYGLVGTGQNGAGCPAGDSCNKSIRGDLGGLWEDEVGEDLADSFDLVFYMTAGHDESGTWQEFGEMMFQTPEDVTDEFGPPDVSLPNWVVTRYVPWTSWLAGSNHWPNAGGGSSTQAESSGAGVYAHELSHLLGIGDNYNNPYATTLSRSYSGIWEMLSRGSFNGPGGPHRRWVVPATEGGSMGSHHMLRNKIELEMVDEEEVLRVTRDGLADSGLVIAEVTAREVPLGDEFGRSGLKGLNVDLRADGFGGDLSPSCSLNDDWRCDRGSFDNYTLEVVDRMGSDSFTPDSGVLMAKTKDRDRAPFIWVIDANPEDIELVDFLRPDGTPAMVSLGDYRQLADGLFKAGTDSGSQDEYVDEDNRLHLYVLDTRRDDEGVLHYTVAVRSLDGSGPHTRGVEAAAGAAEGGILPGFATTCSFPVTNTGEAVDVSGTQPEDVADEVDGDVYRLSAEATDGWEAWLPHELVGVDNGDTVDVPVRVIRDPQDAPRTTVTLEVTSESDPGVTTTATCTVRPGDTRP
ncbi:M6 family metalloprotease domain-containing protein [Salsipaludibacter albus]|uniref:M6 family metalloprotease domain-containing protein n=1 Tax=Salsipaludibacter albus TaxID=2849650 RepID=UPI001EE4AAF0|nr:M6 family metalloprotease domain-containing protein [Salsipaludibacter albus]MBY5161604.1 M6 family metalloprotease domain-containing protein [Salsipaludibacter albus]